MRLEFLTLLTLVLVLNPVSAQDSTKPVMNSTELSHASSIELLGEKIFEHDRAAAGATDQLSALGLHSDRRVKGWVTETTDNGIKVTIVGGENSSPLALYTTVIDRSGAPIGSPIKSSNPAPLTDQQSALYRARTNGLAAKFDACAKNYNTVALATDSGISVYLLPGSTDPNVVPIGGTYRFDYDPKGETQLAKRAYTKSCIALQKDEKSVGMMITHLMDDFPTEIHVYWNLWANSPMYVGIVQTKNLWALNDGKLRLAVRGK